jgi:hypothetical protein
VFVKCSYVRIDAYVVAATVELRFTKLLSLLTRIWCKNILFVFYCFPSSTLNILRITGFFKSSKATTFKMYFYILCMNFKWGEQYVLASFLCLFSLPFKSVIFHCNMFNSYFTLRGYSYRHKYCCQEVVWLVQGRTEYFSREISLVNLFHINSQKLYNSFPSSLFLSPFCNIAKSHVFHGIVLGLAW